MRKIQFLQIFLVAAFLLTSCGVPREVKETMTATLESAYSDFYELRDIRIIQSDKMALTDKDKANEIEERWCIQASFIYRYKDVEWWDDARFSFEAYRRKGEWNYFYPVTFPSDSPDDPYHNEYMDEIYLKCLGK